MGRTRKVGRPKKRKQLDPIYGCARKLTVYVRRKGRIQKIKGYKHRACVE